MSSKFIISGSSLTIEFSYTGASSVVNDTALFAAEYLYNDDLQAQEIGEFSQLTSNQKLAIIDRVIKNSIISSAKKQYIKQKRQFADQEARSEMSDKFIGN